MLGKGSYYNVEVYVLGQGMFLIPECMSRGKILACVQARSLCRIKHFQRQSTTGPMIHCLAHACFMPLF